MRSLFLLLLFCSTSLGQLMSVDVSPVEIETSKQTIERTVANFEGVRVSGADNVVSESKATGDAALIKTSAKADSVTAYSTSFEPSHATPIDDTRYLLVADPGRYLLIVELDGKSTIRPIEIKSRGPPIPPPEPVPPVPPAPTPVKSLAVLIVMETGDLPNLPIDQQMIRISQESRQFLNSVTPKEPSGVHQWRAWDNDLIFDAQCDTVWCKLYGVKRDSLPWIVIGDGGHPVFSGPLPASTNALKTLVGKYK